LRISVGGAVNVKPPQSFVREETTF